MAETATRFLWIIVVSIAAAYGTYSIIGNIIMAEETAYDPVIVRDSVKVGEHHLSGMVTVPSTCDQLTLRVVQLDGVHYKLEFTTWPEPSVVCVKTPTPRSFTATVFAPSVGISFIASLDKRTLPIAVYQTISK